MSGRIAVGALHPRPATRILRIELRRSSAVRSSLLVGACGFGLVYLLVAAFGPDHSWFGIVVNHRSLFTLTAGPLAVGAGAWLGRRDRRGKMEELLTTTPRPRSSRVLPTATALAIALGAVYVFSLGLIVALGLRPIDAYFPLGALPVIANGVLALVGLGLLGLGVGSLLPWPLTPPVSAALGFVVLAVIPQATAADAETRSGLWLLIPELQNHVGPPPSAFLTLGARVNLAQAVWLAALAGTGLALLMAASRRGRALSVIPLVLGAAIAVPMLPERSNDMYVLDRSANELVCTPDAPTICVNRVDGRLLSELVGPGREALAILARKLPPAPTRLEVYGWFAPERTLLPGPGSADCQSTGCPALVREPGVLVLELAGAGHNEAPTIPTESWLWRLLEGAGTARCGNLTYSGDPAADRALIRYLAARMAVAQWLVGAPPPDDPSLDSDPAHGAAAGILAALTSAPADEQVDRVIQLRDLERSCAPGDRAAILTGDSGP
jgi:hypothetical protein